MSNNIALMDLLFPGARQRSLAVLLLRPGESFHLRELARLSGTHAGTLGRELEKLAMAGLLLRSELGNQVRYQADPACPLFDELASIFRKSHGAVGLLREALQPLGDKVRVALVFGSFATGTQTAHSDLDLLVVGRAGFSALVKTLQPLQEILSREINPLLYAPGEFRERVRKGEGILKRVTGQPVLYVVGTKDDLAELAGDPALAGTRR